MSLIDDIKRDREAGTPGPWFLCAHLSDNDACPCGYRGGIFGGDKDGMVCEMGSTVIPGEEGLEAPRYPRAEEIANSRRIARISNMEAALLAAEELADAIDNLAEWQSYDATRSHFSASPPTADGCTDDAKARLKTSLAAYRAATGAEQ